MARNSGARWVEVLREIRSDLPGEWSLRGRGLKAKLFREPIGWAIPWIGGSKASSMRMHAGVIPAVSPVMTFAMGRYGLDMGDIPRGPRSIDLGRHDDLAVARTFSQHALARIDVLTVTHLAEAAEAAIASWTGTSPMPPHLLLAPGWRLVTGAADVPVAARLCTSAVAARPSLDAEVRHMWTEFFATMMRLCEAPDRDAALAWLRDVRDKNLVALGYGPDSIISN